MLIKDIPADLFQRRTPDSLPGSAGIYRFALGLRKLLRQVPRAVEIVQSSEIQLWKTRANRCNVVRSR